MDLSQPISTLLYLGTKDIHEETATNPGAAWLTRGELDKEEYIHFLVVLWHIYDTLERALDRHASHPTLSPTYNPALLARSHALKADILHLSESNSIPPLTPFPSYLSEYVSRVQHVSDSQDPSPLLAHAYVRYLGDLSGGQIIRRNVGKSYNLDLQSGLGTQFYTFSQLGGNSTNATIGDMKKIKEWYREGMNQGVGGDEKRKLAIVEEARLAFHYNKLLLDAIRPPSSKLSIEPQTRIVSQSQSTNPSTFSGLAVLSFAVVLSVAHYALVTLRPAEAAAGHCWVTWFTLNTLAT